MIFTRFKAGGREGSDSYDVLADPTGDGILSGTDSQLAFADFKAGQRCTSTGPNTGNARSTYNGDGLRVGLRTFPGGTITDDAFIWDQGASLPEILQDTQTQNGVSATTTYLYGLAGIIADTDGMGTTHEHLQDGLGSTTQLANTSGAVTDSYTYDAFGAITSHTGTNAQPFTFTGQQQDTNAARGLLYLRARSYDPGLGRFVSQDPLPFLQGYAYADSDPANLIDPTGLCSWSHSWDCPQKAATKTVHLTQDVVENTYVQQCAAWGISGAVAAGAWGAVGGCAAGAGAAWFQRHVSDDPVSQCLIWGGGALVASHGTSVQSVAIAGGCIAGAASWFAGDNAATQCAAWGITALAYTDALPRRRVASGFAACGAGAFGVIGEHLS